MEAAHLLLSRIESSNGPVREIIMGYEVYARNSIR
jgi:hypothetical protein